MTTSPSGKARRRAVPAIAALAILAGCAVSVRNTEPARELARAAQPPGSAYLGWRIYQDRCAGCHGADAAGSAKAPDLLDRMREMGSRRFVNLVLQRYDWSAAPADARRDEAARTALADDILQRRETAFAMPAWQDEPAVSTHVLDLYAYLAARADGTLGPGRPPR